MTLGKIVIRCHNPSYFTKNLLVLEVLLGLEVISWSRLSSSCAVFGTVAYSYFYSFAIGWSGMDWHSSNAIRYENDAVVESVSLVIVGVHYCSCYSHHWCLLIEMVIIGTCSTALKAFLVDILHGINLSATWMILWCYYDTYLKWQ